ncbi:sensor histidine kinase [Pedobacter cryoconitis]|uniref:sensor histidine kinase n=1 Tax=Pedobacter cryoconitis TaxID=188932 RepID=UPI00160A1287|nr:histidine kinase [Pedobacter cryoconitis]MBB5644925.1 sensor histidine kinase YesM [Pedobacter cryoconitis]
MKIPKKYSLVIYHLIFWIFFSALYAFNEYISIRETYFFSFLDVFTTQLPSIVVVYISIYLFSKYTIPNKPVQLIIGILLTFVLNLVQWCVIAYYISTLVKHNPPPVGSDEFRVLCMGTVSHTIKYMVFGFAYAFAMKMIKHEKMQNRLEKERLEAEYAFLRAQVNPHFLNNTLNFFYAKALPLSAELSDGIMTLSQIMRYSLDRNDINRMVMLADELEHVHNVIKLNQMRFSNRLQIDLNFELISSSVQIVPLIIITVVENILKHGDCSLPADPAKVDLFISEDGCFIQLNTYNKKNDWAAEHSNGLGVENIRKRVAHHYGKDFELIIDDNNRSYSLSLKLPVFHKVEFYTAPVNRISSENQIAWSKLFAKKKFNLS